METYSAQSRSHTAGLFPTPRISNNGTRVRGNRQTAAVRILWRHRLWRVLSCRGISGECGSKPFIEKIKATIVVDPNQRATYTIGTRPPIVGNRCAQSTSPRVTIAAVIIFFIAVTACRSDSRFEKGSSATDKTRAPIRQGCLCRQGHLRRMRIR